MTGLETIPSLAEGPPGDGPPRDSDLSELRRVLLNAVRRRCPSWLVDQSEDMVQEVLLRVMEKSEWERRPPTGYLVRAAYNRLIDEIRRRRRHRQEPLEPEGRDSTLPAGDPGPDRALQSRRIGRAVLDCLGRLQRPRRLAVTLYLRGQSAKSSSATLGWPVRKIQNLVFRGLRDLRDCLTQKGIER